MNFIDRLNSTYAYGKVFNYDRSLKEIHFWLIGNKVVNLKQFLNKTKHLNKKLFLEPKRNRTSLNKIEFAKKKLYWILRLPFIYFAGITGSVSINNAKKKDDIDIFIITAPHTLWLVRPIFLAYLELIGLRRKRNTSFMNQKDLICTNLWMDNSKLLVPKNNHNLYTAHEVLQIYPVINKKNSYQKFLSTNKWVKFYLANAYSLTVPKKTGQYENSTFWILLFPLNFLMYLIQRFLMFPISKGEIVTYKQAFFHDQKYADKVLARYNGNKNIYNNLK